MNGSHIIDCCKYFYAQGLGIVTSSDMLLYGIEYRGVQHFYLYDHKKSPSTTKLLLPYIERGMVTLHGPPDEGVYFE